MEDSSPDLSLKLRRGSSDSRDSFYMDFTQGIDSDIEDIATTTSGGGGIKGSATRNVGGVADVTTMIDDGGGCDAERTNPVDTYEDNNGGTIVCELTTISPTTVATLVAGTPKEDGAR